MDLVPDWLAIGILFAGIVLIAVGFSLRRTRQGMLLLGLGVACTLALIVLRVPSAISA